MTPEQLTLDLSAARTARDDGIASVEANSHEEWVAEVDKVIELFAADLESFTSDEVRAVVAREPHHDNAWGARFIAARKRGIIRKVGYRQSARPSGHARPISVWRGSERGQG